MSIKYWSFAEKLSTRLARSERDNEPIRIDTPEQLAEFHRQVGTRPDWHEPDEQDLEARVFGMSFDNAGFWARSELTYQIHEEQHVVFYVRGFPVAALNLASLCSWGAAYGSTYDS